MTEHLSDGKFAPKEVTGKVTGNKGRFKKGQRRPAGAGRKAGTPNKVTRDAKEFLRMMCNKATVQDAVEARILKGDAVAFFRALEHVVGKPKESSEVEFKGPLEVRLYQD